jgi:anti-anti-sigma factor
MSNKNTEEDPMNFDTTTANRNISILHVEGKILGNAADVFREKMKQQLQIAQGKLVVDLMNVPLIDSSALGAIVLTLKYCQKSGGKLVLLNPQKAVREVLEVTQLATVIEIHDSEESASAALM